MVAKSGRQDAIPIGALIGERLRELIDASGVSIAAHARELGVPREYLSKALHGQTAPGAAKLRDFAEYFGVSADYLLGVTTEPGDPRVKLTRFETKLLDTLRRLSQRRESDAEAIVLLLDLVYHHPQRVRHRVQDFAKLLGAWVDTRSGTTKSVRRDRVQRSAKRSG